MRRKTFWQNRHYLSLASLSVNTCLLSQWDQNVYEVLLKFLCTFIFTKSCGLTHKKIQFSRASEMYENRYLLYPCNVFGDFCIFCVFFVCVTFELVHTSKWLFEPLKVLGIWFDSVLKVKCCKIFLCQKSAKSLWYFFSLKSTKMGN